MRQIPSMSTLRAFEAAARHRSFSRAGEELGLTHGAISHRIRELEERLGERLFVRQGNAMEPAPAAARYLASVRQALDLLSTAFGTVEDRATCTLHVAVLPSFASHWLVARLPRFRALHPSIVVALDARRDVVPLGRGHSDAAVRHGPGDWPGTHGRRLLGEVAVPVCAPAYRDRMDLRRPADLARCRLLRNSYVPWMPWFAAAGLNMREPRDEGAAFTDYGLLIDIALAGDGVLLGREVLVADALASGRLVRLSDVAVPVDGAYWFVQPKAGQKHGKEAAIFGDWLAAALEAEFPASAAPASPAGGRGSTHSSRQPGPVAS